MSLKSRTHFLTKVYLQSTGTCVGPDEHQGPLGNYFDHYFEDYMVMKKHLKKQKEKCNSMPLKNVYKKLRWMKRKLNYLLVVI